MGGVPGEMKPAHQELVAQVATVIEQTIQRSLARLAGVGLTPSIRPPRGVGDDYEVCVEFVGAGGVADVLEFHVIQDGRPLADLPAIIKWFEESLADVIDRAEAKLGVNRPRS